MSCLKLGWTNPQGDWSGRRQAHNIRDRDADLCCFHPGAAWARQHGHRFFALRSLVIPTAGAATLMLARAGSVASSVDIHDDFENVCARAIPTWEPDELQSAIERVHAKRQQLAALLPAGDAAKGRGDLLQANHGRARRASRGDRKGERSSAS